MIMRRARHHAIIGAKGDELKNMRRVEGRLMNWIFRRAGQCLRTVALVVLAAGATACGGGGGGGDGGGGGGGGSTPTGNLTVTVVDEANVTQSGASVQAASGGATINGTTAANGTVTLNGIPAGSANVTVSLATFTTRTVSQAITANQTASLTVVLVRTTRATGGVVETRVPTGSINPDRSQMEFSVRVVVVDENSAGIDGLTESAFTLLPCPITATPEDDCVRSPDPIIADEYTVTGPGNPSFESVAGQGPFTYAAVLHFDQSRSIIQTDPTDARLFSAKEFLNSLGSNGGSDQVVLSAFARSANVDPNGDCLLPACVDDANPPLEDVTIFPYNPSSPTVASFTADGASYLDTVDELAELEGGTTPLYSSIDTMLNSAFAANTGTDRKAVVVFTDGRDETCGNASQCQTARNATIARSTSTDVDIFTIGLAGEVDGIALAELADGGRGIFLFAEDAAQLIPIYGSLGHLLSDSLTTYRLRYRISAAAGSFAVGNAVRGVVQVTVGADTIRIPFIVRIF
jgi:hypothetical protein